VNSRMTDLLRTTYDDFEALADEAQIHTFGARALELQKTVREKVEAFALRLSQEKAAAVKRADEKSANELLLLSISLAVVHHELSMWISLKADDGEAAWDDFVEAQRLCEAAIRLRRHLLGSDSVRQLENLAMRYDEIERSVFPPQVFCSIGGVATHTTCSICGADYDACDHIVGRPYMGALCSRVVRQMEVEEISLVPEPASKHCRVTHFSDGPLKRNRMTWRLEDPPSEHGPTG
jgi:hypothetical protein